MVQGMLLNFITLNPSNKRIILSAGLDEVDNIFDGYDMFKRLSNKMKKLQNIVRDDLTKVFEFEVLLNRITKDIDIEGEKKNRTESKLVEYEDSRVYGACTRMFEYAKKEKNIPLHNVDFKAF